MQQQATAALSQQNCQLLDEPFFQSQIYSMPGSESARELNETQADGQMMYP
jgi:hypothetical protein